MMKYMILNNFQLFILSILVGLISASAVVLNSWYQSYVLLPKVSFDRAGQCIKVVNYENGHAFSCHDVDVTLRRYRRQVAEL